jgi:parvulin-like peptidyl-prolyl isomerase
MVKIKISILLVVSFLLTGYVNGQDKEDVVAKVGSQKVTVDEYRERFELTPHVGASDWNIDTTKFEYLCSIIAEKLWGMEAARLGYDTNDVVKYSNASVEKLYVRDALYKEVIADKIELPQKDILKGVYRKGLNLKVNMIISKDSTEIFEIFSALNKGASLDSILAGRPESKEQDTAAIEVSYGQLEEFVEDTVYSLKLGEYTAPFKTKSGWFIFKLVGKYNSVNKNFSQNDIYNSVKKVVSDRQAEILYQKYYRSFFPGHRVEADGLLFWSIADKITKALIEDRKNPDTKKSANIYLTVDDLKSIEKQLGPDTLGMQFIKLEGRVITVKEFLRSLLFDGFYTNVFEPKIIGAKLNSRVKIFIEQELLALEANKKGLQNHPDVKRDIDMWQSNYTSQLLRNTLRDSAKVTDDEVYKYYLEKQKSKAKPTPQVNIVEVLTDSLEVVEKVLNELKQGKDIKDLALEHTKRTWTKKNGGQLGYFPVTMYGELGSTAAKMNVGEVYGPLKLPEGYSVFKLLDKKIAKDSADKPFDEVKEELKKECMVEKFQKLLIDKTVDLANKYGVTINDKVLKELNVTNLNMFTYRYMGFGGRIAAVPLAVPLYDWYTPYMKSKKDLP